MCLGWFRRQMRTYIRSFSPTDGVVHRIVRVFFNDEMPKLSKKFVQVVVTQTLAIRLVADIGYLVHESAPN